MDTLLGHIITERSITAYFAPEGTPSHADVSHPNYEAIKEKLQSGDLDGLRDLFSIEEAVKEYIAASGKASGLEIRHGEAFYQGSHLDNALGKKLVEEVEAGRPINHYVNFLDKVMENPSKTAVDELLLFIEAGYMAICPDGDFLAYKKVRDNFHDIHSGRFDNSPGQKVTMPRNQVDDNRDRTCSAGLHFCSYAYLSCFGNSYSNKVVLLKINPKDVVSIPADYNNTKGRTCAYEVLQEVTGWQQEDVMASDSFYSDFDSRYVEDDGDDDFDFLDDLDDEETYTPFW